MTTRVVGPRGSCDTELVRILICPDKFRGTATAGEVVDALRKGLPDHDVVGVPLADGGEGTLDALGGPNRTATVTGPLGEPVEADWRLHKGRAVIEMARASGLLLAGGADDNSPLDATTAGTGELISLAVDRGATEVIIGVGGSATTDGGLGALRAMNPLQRFRGIDLTVACDVETRFTDAAAVFGPQKGASAAQIKLLEARLERLVQVYRDEHGVDLSDVPRAGAAGGLAGGLAAVGASLVDGFSAVADAVGLVDHIEGADLVITGEGKLDDQSFEGKVVGGVAGLAAEFGTPVVAVAGLIDLSRALPDGVASWSLTEQFGAGPSLSDTRNCLTDLAPRLLDAAG